jgi:multicomponent Na+:H+ antiporter subunit F
MTAAVVFVVACALAALTLAVARLVRGPSHSDRIVAQDVVFSVGLALCLAAALLTGRSVFLDVALGLAVVGFVATIAWARLIQTLAADRGRGAGEEDAQ